MDDRRKNWVEKTSTDLARRFDIVAVERWPSKVCGHHDNADVNAARNIKDTAVGRTVAAPGGTPLGGPVNREPQPALLSV